MAKFIDWYSVELDSFLRGRIADEHRFEAVKEVTNHLSEHVDDLVSKGMNEVEAQKAALAAFGSPRDASMNLLNQGPRSKVGGYFSTLGAIAIFASMLIMTMFTQMLMMHLKPGTLFDYPFRYWNVGASLMVASVPLGLGGAYFSRRVSAKKYLIAFGAGVLVAGAYLLAGPERQFADVPREKFVASLDQWKKDNEDTKKLAKLDQSIRTIFVEKYSSSSGDILPIDKAAAIAKISEVAPQMLKINSKFVELTGTETKGYLVPTRSNDSDDYYLTSGSYRSGYAVGTLAGDYRDDFPRMQLSMKYVKTEAEALSAWRGSNRRYSNYGESEFRSIAVMQHDFIRSAENYAKESRASFAGIILSGIAAGTLGYVLFILLASWLVTKIPSVSFRSTFKKVVA